MATVTIDTNHYLPGLIGMPRLSGPNWIGWYVQIRAYMRLLGLWDYVCYAPNDHKYPRDPQRTQAAMDILVLGVDQTVLTMLYGRSPDVDFRDANQLMEELRGMFGSGDINAVGIRPQQGNRFGSKREDGRDCHPKCCVGSRNGETHKHCSVIVGM